MTRKILEDLHTHYPYGEQIYHRQVTALSRPTTEIANTRLSKNHLSEDTESVRDASLSMTSSLEKTPRKGLIGIITSTLDSAYYGQVMEKASICFNERGYESIVVPHAKNKTGELNAQTSLDELDCDGLIVFSTALDDEELAAYLDSHPVAVLMNRYLPKYYNRCVYLDNAFGGRLAAQYLVDKGHTAIAMVTGPPEIFEIQERSNGFLAALENHTQRLKPVMTLSGNLIIEDGAKAIVKILDSKEAITAVFFHNDSMAIGALEKCHQLGVDIPGELSILGYDDLVGSRHTYPTLTTIHQPIKKMGRAAAQLICGMLDKDNPVGVFDIQAYYRPVLVERESVKNKGISEEIPRITEREIECLQWASIGKTAWEISMILSISERTVGFHLANAAVKLQANNRTHAVSTALKKGLITG